MEQQERAICGPGDVHWLSHHPHILPVSFQILRAAPWHGHGDLSKQIQLPFQLPSLTTTEQGPHSLLQTALFLLGQKILPMVDPKRINKLFSTLVIWFCMSDPPLLIPLIIPNSQILGSRNRRTDFIKSLVLQNAWDSGNGGEPKDCPIMLVIPEGQDFIETI